MKKAYFALICKILVVVFALSTALIFTASGIMLENASAVSGFFNAQTQIVYEEDDGEERDSIYYKTQFNSVAEVIANGEELCEEVVAEGAVLLINDDGALPLSKGGKVTLYGAGSTNIVIGGGGSSVTGASSVNLKDALEDSSVGLDVNDDMYNWYSSHTEYGRKVGTGIGARSTIGEAPWSVLPADAKTAKADAAIFVVTRTGSEDADAYLNSGDNSDMTNGNYLALSPAERDVLTNLKKLKGTAFNKIIMILNTTNQVELNFADSEELGIDSILWCGSLGSTGTRAVGDILVGNVNPSGRLSDTFWANHRYNPVNANFGDYTFGGTMADGGDPENLAIYDYGTTYRVGYVVYQEGIYVGYRYTETRYEDYVTRSGNAGDYDYSEVVAYPFGYGMSYTTFGYSSPTFSYDAETDVYTVSVTVTNTGNTAGKETVQVYAQKPYTDYDKARGVEKAAVELVGFAKTGMLEGGVNASETVSIEVPGEYLAAYDSNGKGTYIAEEGDHYLTIARDAHDAANNILAAKGHTPENTAGRMDAAGDASLAYEITLGADSAGFAFDSDGVDAEKYSVADTGAEIVNHFDYADINRYENRGDNSVTYVSRKDWNGTVKFGIGDSNVVLENQVRLTLNAALESDLREEKFQKAPEDDIAYPTYGSTKTAYTLMDLRAWGDGDDDPTNDEPIPYDDPMWDDLLDQLTWEDTVKFLSCGERMTSAIDTIAKPQTIDHNGAVGVNQRFNNNEKVNRGFAVTKNDPDKNEYPSAYPCNGIAAATFNVELMTKYGEAWGEDALWAGYAGLYGPGLNMHRSPYGGRNFEYFSEDSVLAGKICSALSEAIEEKGIYVYLKHPLLNDQEEGRRTISTWANEQTIREIYARPFEICIEEGGTSNIMTGLNKIGPTNNIFTGFVDDLFRGEFGMEGFAVTDYMHNAQSQVMPVAHLYGVDIPDRDYSTMSAYVGYETGHGALAWAMRESVHHVLYTVVHSAAMNGMTANTRIITIKPDWQYILNMFTWLSVTLLIASVLLLATCYAFPWVTDKIKALLSRGKANGAGNDNGGTGGGANAAGGSAPDSGAGRTGSVAEKGTNVGAGSAVKAKSAPKQSGSVSAEAYMSRKDPFYVWIIRAVIVAALIVAVIVQSVVLTDGVRENRRLIQELTGYNEGRIYEQNGGDGVKSNVFEAEALAFSGSVYDGETDTGHACAPIALTVSGKYSGGVAVGGLAVPEGAEKNTLTLKVVSDKKVRITMSVRVVTATAETPFAEGYTVSANGKTPRNMADAVVGARSAVGELADVGLVIDLEAGENTVVFTAESNAFAIDSIDMQTSATLTEFAPQSWDMSGFAVTQAPTDDAGGVISVADDHATASYDIPSVFAGVASGVYGTVTDGDKISVRLGSTSVEVNSRSAEPHTLTLDTDNVTFADGSKTKELAIFSKMPEVVTTLPEGSELIGWYDASDWTKVYGMTDFVMFDYAVTLVPVIEDGNYAVEVSDDPQQVCLNPAKKDGITPIRTDLGEGFDMLNLRDGMTTEAMPGNGAGTAGTVYNYNGSIGQGWSFLTMNACDYTENGTKSLIYVYENKGDTTVSFDVWQTGSSSAPKAEGNPHMSVTLAPGEWVRFVMSFDFKNNNLLTYHEFTAPTSDLRLACAQYIVKGEYVLRPSESSVLSSVEYSGSYKSAYYAGESFDATGLTLTAKFTDGTDLVLSDGEFEISPETISDGQEYVTVSYTHGNVTRSVNVPVRVVEKDSSYNVTITGGASFTDGMTETIVTAGDALPEVQLTGENAETGKRLVGWVVNNGGEYSFAKADEFVMPQADVEITPYVTLGWEFNIEYGGGVLDLSEDRTVVAPGDQHFPQSFISNISDGCTVSRSGRYVMNGDKVGTEYSFTGETGMHFRLVRTCTVNSSTMRTITYTVKNTGESEISFTAHQVNSGTDTTNAPSSGNITLAPGEERTFDLSFEYGNANVMLLVTLDADANDATLWMSAEISDPQSVNTATITGGAQFADGTTSKIVAIGEKLPEVVLTGDNAAEGKRLTGWVAEYDGKKVFADADFTMPDSDVTLTPYVTLGWEYGKGYGGGVLDLSEDRTVTEGTQLFAQSFISNITVDSASISGRYVLNGDKVGTEYSFTGQANEYFRLVRACVVSSSNERTITYTIKNTGNTAVSFIAHQVNSGSVTTGAPSSGNITLAPGEEKTFDLTFAYNNQNVMLLITLDADATNARIWVSAEISD